ncbi:ribosome recycling factor [Pyruvatibacter sp.]|uniref:ribosome recycling factor n=1 Tax=unclassified Pyruvatibacter TaxID=2618840 RepID=UPI00296A72D4|nr:ribosome recycling factor [Alphaproteobacteria bacterium]
MAEDGSGVDLDDIELRMHGALDNLMSEFGGLRTGRASASLLDPVMVDAYGAKTPLNQVGNVSVPEPRLITVSVWDKGLVGPVEKAIRDAGLGVNPVADGTLIRVGIPELNEERRVELTKVAGKYAEAARVAVRNVRRDAMDHLKKAEKGGDIGKDDHKKLSEKVQGLTDKAVADVDAALATKEAEIMQV